MSVETSVISKIFNQTLGKQRYPGKLTNTGFYLLALPAQFTIAVIPETPLRLSQLFS